MAMDKNEKLVLFKKVPSISDKYLLDIDDRLQFIDVQILERQKVLWRELVTVKQAEKWADLEDKDANKAAETAVQEATVRIKSLKLELDSLMAIRKELETE